MPLTAKQQRFCEEYLIDLNATQAAIRAGYSAKTAHAQGPRLLENVGVAEAIQAGMNERSERTEITADYVLKGIRDTVEACKPGGTSPNPQAALKGYELLGKHLKMFPTSVNMGSDPDNPPSLRIEIIDPTRPE